jgi:hypothetical protein
VYVCIQNAATRALMEDVASSLAYGPGMLILRLHRQ